MEAKQETEALNNSQTKQPKSHITKIQKAILAAVLKLQIFDSNTKLL
jgi:hypothetical protein